VKYFFTLLLLLAYFVNHAQDNYEIQVYGSQTQAPRSAIFELHTNYTFIGEKAVKDGVVPSYHALHETVEITMGVTPIFEIGAYLFTAWVPGYGYQVVGTHLRPRVMAPKKWNWPVGVSLSTEIGYQKPEYSSSTWSIEIRPIVDKQWEKLYISFNPTLGIALKSQYEKSTPTFEPNLKLSYSFFPNGSLGIEYYGDIGYINDPDQFSEQGDAIFLTYDLLNNVKWEFNVGAGAGLTSSTDRFVFKVILGRRINWQKK